VVSACVTAKLNAPELTATAVEAVYNGQRRHSALDILRPVDYEEPYWIAVQRLNSGAYPSGTRPLRYRHPAAIHVPK
jgi:hypothetical protein